MDHQTKRPDCDPILIIPVSFLLWLVAAACPAIEISPERPVEHKLVHVKYDVASGGVVFVLGIKDGKLISPDIVDVTPGYLVFTGPPGSYSVHGIEAGKRFSSVVEIGGLTPWPPPGPGPMPPPGPPPLTGLAAQVEREARMIGDPVGSLKLAANFKTLCHEIDSGKFTTPESINRRAAELNRQTKLTNSLWGGFGLWLNQQYQAANANTIAKVRELVSATELGLRTAGGG